MILFFLCCFYLLVTGIIELCEGDPTVLLILVGVIVAPIVILYLQDFLRDPKAFLSKPDETPSYYDEPRPDPFIESRQKHSPGGIQTQKFEGGYDGSLNKEFEEK